MGVFVTSCGARSGAGLPTTDPTAAATEPTNAQRPRPVESAPAIQAVPLPDLPEAVDGVASPRGACIRDNSGGYHCWNLIGSGRPLSIARESGSAMLRNGAVERRFGSNVIARVDAGETSCVVLRSGEFECWELGARSLRRVSSAPAIRDFISADQDICAVDQGGRLVCGQPGNLAAQSDGWGALRIRKLAGGNGSLCALTADGSVYGAPYLAGGKGPPTEFAGLQGAGGVSCGAYHICASFDDGRVACVGDHGLPDDGDPSQPVTVTGIPHAKEMVSDTFSSCLRSEAGEVWCWGARLGEARRVEDLDASHIWAAMDWVCALTASGAEVHCWGETAATPSTTQAD